MITKERIDIARGRGKGFTLIEILIVVAIIAILASVVLVGLGPTQREGRDSRRISDLHETQNALELYFNHCTYYPGTANCASGAVATSYSTMSGALTGTTAIGTTQVPNDPSTGKVYYYYGTPATNANTYVLAAQLEDTSNAAMGSSLTASSTPTGITTGVDGTCGTAGFYCISL